MPTGEIITTWEDFAEDGRMVFGVRASDNESPAREMGYELELIAGELPANCTLPKSPLCPFLVSPDSTRRDSLRLYVNWRDGESHTQPFHFGIRVICLDKAGNRSEPSDTVWVSDPGRK
jgi:hypothetical protein